MQWIPLILLFCLYVNVLSQSNCTSVECQEEDSNDSDLKLRMSPSKKRGKCGDTSKNCKHWALQGLCRSKKRSSQMKINLCSQTCNRCSNNNTNGKKKREKPYSVWQNSLDERQDPCQNFYQFTCGTYIKQNKPKTPNSVTSPLSEIGQKVSKQKLDLILDNTETDSTAIQKLRQYRDTCKNQTAVEIERTISLRKDIESLGGCPMLVGRSKWKSSNFDLTNALIGFTNFSSNEFIVDIIPDKMNDGNIYLRFWPAQLIVKVPMIYNETRAEQKIQFLEDFLISLMSIVASDMRSGQTFASISKAIKEVIQLDKKFAGALAPFWPAPTDPDEFEKKAVKIRFSELKKLLPSINFVQYMRKSARVPKEVNKYFDKDPFIFVYTRELFQQLDQIIKNTDKRIMANYLFTRYVVANIPYLDSRFSAAGNSFAEKLDGFKRASNRDQDCLDTITSNFPLVIDHLFISKHFDSKARESVSEMVEDLRSAMSDMISEEKWMQPSTKSEALKKLKKTRKVIAAVKDALNQKRLDQRYQDVKFDFPKDSYRQMATKVVLNTARRLFMNVIRPEIYTYAETMRTTDVNALNIPDENLIFMSSAIAQSPLFDPKMPASISYGGLGFIVGHELTHSFDNDGSKYDEDGKKKEWFDSKSKAEFLKRSDCFVKQYGKLREKDVQKRVNGKKTLGENIADNGGIKAAFRAYQRHLKLKGDKRVPGYSRYTNEQAFFINAGVSFCQAAGLSHKSFLLEVDDHSPNIFRINTVMQNFPEFSRVFKCRQNTPMNPKNRCSVW